MKLKFINYKLINYEDLPNLPDWQNAQLIDLAERAYGITAEKSEDVLKQTYEGDCEFWQVVDLDEDPDRILYDCWIFDVDTGVVFQTQTTEDARIWMVQSYFDVSDEFVVTDEERGNLEKLADAFAEGYEITENEIDLEEKQRIRMNRN